MKVLSWDIGTENLAYCLGSCENEERRECVIDIDAWNVFALENTKKNSWHKVTTSLYNELNSLCLHDGFGETEGVKDLIIVENQLGLQNGKMKTIQMLIFSYYVMATLDNPNVEVIMANAGNKLKCYGELVKQNKAPLITVEGGNLKKKLAIEHCRYFIRNNSDYLDFFNSHKKKDDLADCYLQGLYYLQRA